MTLNVAKSNADWKTAQIVKTVDLSNGPATTIAVISNTDYVYVICAAGYEAGPLCYRESVLVFPERQDSAMKILKLKSSDSPS
jgi:hypothetical protein